VPVGLSIVIATLALGAVVQSLCVRRDRRRFPAPGRIVNGRHVRQIGTDGPAVLFEAGLTASSSGWLKVQNELAAFAQTFSYDRPGLGWSAPVDEEISLERLTDELHALVGALDVPRPFVLVGHSFGTYIARAYAHRFREDVAALVLIDPVASLEWEVPGQRNRLARAVFFSHVAGALASVGLVRLGLWGVLRRGHGKAGPLLGLSSTMRRIAGEVAKLPPDLVPPLRAQWSDRRFFVTMARYIRSLPACAIEAAERPIPAGLPVIVLSGAHQSPDYLAAHRALATRHLDVTGTGHWIHLDHPEVVAREIRSELK
jgi:pimeloyl-ACP methyl ester carboxylesterase